MVTSGVAYLFISTALWSDKLKYWAPLRSDLDGMAKLRDGKERPAGGQDL
jgi:hypothetical protein